MILHKLSSCDQELIEQKVKMIDLQIICLSMDQGYGSIDYG